ncbi:MAG: Crp/Fnr family transcriptional regulator [Rhodospirillaceae bacterium]
MTNDEAAALNALPVRMKEFAKGETLVREGERPTQSFTITEGLTAIYKTSNEGRRQIMIFQVPGDFPDLQSLHLNVLDMSIVAVSKVKVGFIQHQDIRLTYHRFPRLGEALWRMSLVDAAMLRERMLNLGQRKAHPRVAHFFCEMYVRLKLAGCELSDQKVSLPLTQQEIGDALGLSNVHVNRVVQDLKEDGLMEMKRGWLRVLNWKRLQKAAAYDMTYLHLTPAQRLLLET